MALIICWKLDELCVSQLLKTSGKSYSLFLDLSSAFLLIPSKSAHGIGLGQTLGHMHKRGMGVNVLVHGVVHVSICDCMYGYPWIGLIYTCVSCH